MNTQTAAKKLFASLTDDAKNQLVAGGDLVMSYFDLITIQFGDQIYREFRDLLSAWARSNKKPNKTHRLCLTHPKTKEKTYSAWMSLSLANCMADCASKELCPTVVRHPKAKQ